MTTVTLEHISKKFEQSAGSSTRTVAALNNVSIKIPSGDVLAVLGMRQPDL